MVKLPTPLAQVTVKCPGFAPEGGGGAVGDCVEVNSGTCFSVLALVMGRNHPHRKRTLEKFLCSEF